VTVELKVNLISVSLRTVVFYVELNCRSKELSILTTWMLTVSRTLTLATAALERHEESREL